MRLVLEAVPADATVLDLYAGAGLFALPLARRGHQVVAVEANPTAVADGEASLRLNRIPAERCRFIAKPVGAVTTPRRRRHAPSSSIHRVRDARRQCSTMCSDVSARRRLSTSRAIPTRSPAI